MSQLQKKKKQMLNDLMRETLYKSARTVIEEYGWKGTTMERVALEAGIAKGTVYNYFKNKRELMRFVMEKHVEPLNKEIEFIVNQKISSMAKTLALIIETVTVGMVRNKRIISSMILAFHEDVDLRRDFDPKIHPLEQTQLAIVKIIEKGIQNGEFRSTMDATLAGAMIHALFTGLSRQIALGLIDVTEEKIAQDVTSFVLRGLLASPEGGTL